MRFFVDTADVEAIRELDDLGMVDGVTTNPSLIMKSGRDIIEVTKEICDLVEGPVSAEVVAKDAADMIREGKLLAAVNQTLVEFTHPLNAGDEVAFFPPVTGG